MLLIHLLITIFTLIVNPITASSVDTSAQYGNHHMKRWYGVQKWDPSTPNPNRITPWPMTCSNPIRQPIRYCFADLRSARNLQPIVDAAIKRWGHAMLHSSMTIELDPGAYNDPEVLCSNEMVASDALVISDETKDGDEAWNTGPECSTASTVGYLWDKSRYRHWLYFCAYTTTTPGVWWMTKEYAIPHMMHELGHAMGLQHEHQRPDRDEYVQVYYHNMMGYDEAREAVSKDTTRFPPSVTDVDTRTHWSFLYAQWARIFFPAARDYVKGNAYRNDAVEEDFKSYEFSDRFDYDSIMIYSSDMNIKNEGKWTMTRKPDGGMIYQGGNKDHTKASISAGDIARVAQLYDNGTPGNKAAQNGGTWGPIKVAIRGDEAEVIHPPWSKRDEL